MIWSLWKDLLHGDAVDQNEDQSDNVHEHECGNDNILYVEVNFTATCHSNQHPTDAELNRNNGRAVANFKDQEELVE